MPAPRAEFEMHKEINVVVVTGATGKLGTHVIKELIERVSADQIVAAVRSPAKAGELKTLGIAIREADYTRPDTLSAAFAGADKLLLISSNEIGPSRIAQHQTVIDAAVKAGVKLIAYTSVLRADTSKLGLAEDHLATEKAIIASGLPYIFLRNGWYLENHTEALKPALEHGAILGAAGAGRFSSASRADYAAAAAVALASGSYESKVYELAGDSSFSLQELAAEVTKISGKTVNYRDLPEADYATALESFGLPAPVALMLAQSDTCAAQGDLESDSHDLSSLIGRPTTTLATAVRDAVK